MNPKKMIVHFIVFVNLLFTFTQVHSADSNVSEIPKKKWISLLFREAEMTFQMDPKVNENCFQDFLLYKSHLRNQSIWAVKMLESSEWPSVGLFSGRLNHLGNYDECLSISSYGIKGQYCLAQVAYNNLDEHPDFGKNPVQDPDQKISVWEALAMYRSDPVRVNRQKLRFALCIPSSCRTNDLKISLNRILSPIFLEQHLNVSVDVDPILCKTSEQGRYPREFYIVRWLFVSIFVLVVSSTCLHVVCDASKKAKKTSPSLEIFKPFSIVENFRKLTNVNPETDHLFLHFGKVFLMMSVVVHVHRVGLYMYHPKFEAETLEQSWKWRRYLFSHANIIDVFFAITGFLTFHNDHLSMKKGGLLYLFVSVLSRWIRMVSVFLILMLYIIYILPYTGDGPLWNYGISNEVSRCEQSWWTSLLAINNIVKTDLQCLMVSWYISVDIQLSIIGAVLLYMYSKNEKLAIKTLIWLLIGSMLLVFVIVYVNKYHGMILVYLTSKDLRDEVEFTNFYGVTYPRIIPYLIGFLSAFVTKILKEKEYKFSTTQRWVLFFLGFIMSEGVVVYASSFYVFGRGYSRVEHAIFASLNRLLFIFVYAILFCMDSVSGLGIFDKFFKWKGFAPLGRLTYSVFLLNMVIQLYYSASQKQPLPVGEINVVWLLFGDVVVCYAIGLVLYIFIEAPISNISKILKKRTMKAFVKVNMQEDTEFSKLN